MMGKTEKELLELAAKSIGMKTTLLPSIADPDRPHERPWEIEDSEWNPLEDDGDAIRLAEKLDMRIKFDMQIAYGPLYEGLPLRPVADWGYNLPAKTWRDAVVKVAAEIGEQMP